MQVFKEMVTTVIVNKREIDATIKIITEFDDTFSLDEIDFNSEKEKNAMIALIENNTITPMMIKVEVCALTETADASIGQVLVKSNSDITAAVMEYELIKEATESLIDSVKSKYELLNVVFGGENVKFSN